MVGPGSILVGKRDEIDVFVQLESTSERWLGFEKLVEPRSILLGKYAEVDILL